MSTLRVTTIQDESGSNASTAEEINKGRAKAWVKFNGTTGSGTGYSDMTMDGSFNVSSVTDGGTGIYTVNFTNAMPDANYAIVLTANEYFIIQGAIPTTNGFRVHTYSNYSPVAYVDAQRVYAAVFN